MHVRFALSAAALGLVALSLPRLELRAAQSAAAASGQANAGSITTGLATSERPMKGVPPACPQPVTVQPDVYPIRIGTISSSDGKQWTVPGPVNDEGAIAADIYNNCTGTGDNPNYRSELKTVVIDSDGVEITGYIFSDNYFELYVNGRYVARDSIPMTPFNTSVVRFKARYPMTYAIMSIDWETHLGVGMEYAIHQLGDAGMVAHFSDGNGTRGDWRSEVFYIAPVDDPSCVRVTAAGRDSSFCSQAVRPTCAQKDPRACKALHFPIPADWAAPGFDDSRWPASILWPATVVTNQRAFVGYKELFGDSEFIWTRNLHLDNLVLSRYTAKGPR